MMKSGSTPLHQRKSDPKSDYAKTRNPTDTKSRVQAAEQKSKTVADQKAKTQTEQKSKTQTDVKKTSATAPDPKPSRPTELKKRRSTSDLMASIGRAPRQQSAAMENLSKAKRVKECMMEALQWVNMVQTFEKTPFRCAVLRAHYNWTSGMFFLIFFYAVSTYYGEEPIRCIDQYDRSKADKDVLDICVQFPYTMKNDRARDIHEKKYATFYMWAHWGCGLMVLFFKIVHVAVFLLENKGLKRFLDTLQKNIDYNYRIHLVRTYFQENYGNHQHLILKVMALHVIALAMNVIVFFVLDLFLDFRYMTFPRYLLIKRDFVHFDDEFSLMFPPFVECEISPLLHIQVGRTNFYGCHLPLMEFYEKIFMMLWFWQVFLAIWTIISLSFWSSYLCFKKFKLDAQELFRYKETKSKIKKLPIDEVVVLNLVKNFLFGQHYRAFLHALLKWNPNTSELEIPLDEYKINYPYVLRGLSSLVDEDLETFFDDIQQEIPVSLREEAFAKDSPPTGWKLNLPLNNSFKPKPSAPSDGTFSYQTAGEDPPKGYFTPEKYGWATGKSSDRSDSGIRTPSTVPAKDAYRSPSPDSSEDWNY